MKRPWSGQVEKSEELELPEFDPKNPLCPGVTRPSGDVNPEYESTFVFTNDFPALLEDVPQPEESSDPLFKTDMAKGTCKVMCFAKWASHSFSFIETLRAATTKKGRSAATAIIIFEISVTTANRKPGSALFSTV